MRLYILTLSIILTGLFIPAYNANANIIKPTDRLRSDYEIHHRIIVYNNLSSYQNPDNKKELISQESLNYDLFNKNNEKSKKLEDLENGRLTRFPIKRLTDKNQSNLILNIEENNNYGEIAVGSFLDNFKEDPLLQTIYFTSKDLIFSYKRKIANAVDLGFDMEAKTYGPYKNFRDARTEKIKKPLTEKEKKKLTQETQIIFGLISESYKNIAYVILAMLAALALSFRYILNKYI